MSLFKTKEWWRTECGPKEGFNKNNLLVAPLLGSEAKDVIIIGSHNGYLRIYSPSSRWSEDAKSVTGYKSTDLIIELKVSESILDLKMGRFVSGSQEPRLAVLTPHKLIIYVAKLTSETTEYGDRCVLEEAYVHAMPRFPVLMTTGPFGGAQGRDFICVQTFEGTLLFYEQEAYVYSRAIKDALLPEPLTYVTCNDIFITLSPNWILESYKYSNIAESGKKLNKDNKEVVKILEPDWSYNLGEPILDINVVTLSSFEAGVIVLGERNLYSFGEGNLTLKYMKRFEYNALCFQAYVIEPDGKLMVMVVADTNTLMVYEGTTLKWSAQVPFAPVAITRANFQYLEGIIVMLSDDGRLETCYLGSEPSLFTGPQVHRRGFDYQAAEQELKQIRTLAKSSSAPREEDSDPVVESELQINVTCTPELEMHEGVTKIQKCKVIIEVASYTNVEDIQVSLKAAKSLIFSRTSYTISNLCQKHKMELSVWLAEDLPPVSAQFLVVATYGNDNSSFRVVEKSATLPLKIFMKTCALEPTAAVTVTIKRSGPSVHFNQLFPEFMGEYSKRQVMNSLGLQFTNSGHVVTIATGLKSDRYRIQSNDVIAMPLFIQQVIERLREKSSENLSVSINQNHFQVVIMQIDAHFAVRLRMKNLMREIKLTLTQLRNIEKKFLRSIREPNAQSLTSSGLPMLLSHTHSSLLKFLDDYEAAQKERERLSQNLQASLKLILLLLRLNMDQEKHAQLESALSFEAQTRNDIDWEEITDLALTSLAGSDTKKSEMKSRSMAQNQFEAKDVEKFKKRFIHAIDRLNNERGKSDVAENDAE